MEPTSHSVKAMWLKCVLYQSVTVSLISIPAADDIIRQHKAACLRITSLLVCKDLLWIGTSAGVILTVPIPRITSTSTKGSHNVPAVTGRFSFSLSCSCYQWIRPCSNWALCFITSVHEGFGRNM